jgi:hypothetical protein
MTAIADSVRWAEEIMKAWLPRGYLRGFVGPSRNSLEKPLCCFFKDTHEWEDVSPAEIGYGEGFYDYAAVSDGAVVTAADSVFARLEREFPLRRDSMSSSAFADWQEHKQFLLEFMQMLRARSPLGMQHFGVEARNLRGATISAVDEERRSLTLDSLEMRPLPKHAIRNFTISTMLRDVAVGVGWAAHLDWCLRFTDEENEGFYTTDQAIFVEGKLQLTDEHGRMTQDLLHHPDTPVYFPLCWQACLFGSPLQFNSAYDRAQGTTILRENQKRYAERFLISPVIF